MDLCRDHICSRGPKNVVAAVSKHGADGESEAVDDGAFWSFLVVEFG
jgi:hypothetical protein